MKKIIVLISVLFIGLFVLGCSSTPKASPVEFWHSIPEGQENVSLDFFSSETSYGAKVDTSKVVVSIRGNEMTLTPPIEPSSNFSYFLANGIFRTDLQNSKDSEAFDVASKVFSDGIYELDSILVYVNKAGSFSLLVYKWTFPEEGWYLANMKKEVFKLEPPHYTLPDGYHWIVMAKPEPSQPREVIWWKK